MPPISVPIARGKLVLGVVASLATGCFPVPTPPGPAAPTTPSVAATAPSDVGATVIGTPVVDARRATELLAPYLTMRKAALPSLTRGGMGDGVTMGTDSAPATAPEAVSPVAGCAGLAVRSGAELAIDGRPFTFFGVNAHYLLDKQFDEERVEPLLQEMSDRGINTVRVWYFDYHDPERMTRLLDAGSRHGIRFVVSLVDNVFHGIDWFIDDGKQEEYVAHLDETVQRFKDRPEILIWELANEPNCGEGRHDDDCLETIRGWVGRMATRAAAIDPCRPVSTGMIGDGNYENEKKSFRIVNRKDGIGIVSVHRRSTDEKRSELEFATDEGLPIFYGEIYDVAYDEGCSPLSGDHSPQERADRIKSDLRQAVQDGVDGYLLWEYATSGECSTFGFESDDPLWNKLLKSDYLPPAVPWR